MRFLHTTLGSPAVEQTSPGVGNPDASLSPAGRGNCAGARHGHGDHADSLDSAAQLRACIEHAPRAHTRRRSSAGRGRSRCSKAPLCGSRHRGSVVPGVPSARKSQWVLDRVGRFVKYFPRNVARLGTGRDIGKNLSVWAGVAPASFGRPPFYRTYPPRATSAAGGAPSSVAQLCLPYLLPRPSDGWGVSSRPSGSLQRPSHRSKQNSSPSILRQSPLTTETYPRSQIYADSDNRSHRVNEDVSGLPLIER